MTFIKDKIKIVSYLFTYHYSSTEEIINIIDFEKVAVENPLIYVEMF
jgi:hypothetical protein